MIALTRTSTCGVWAFSEGGITITEHARDCRADVIAAYSPHKSLGTIAKDAGCCVGTVRYHLTRLGLQTLSQKYLGPMNKKKSLIGIARLRDIVWQRRRAELGCDQKDKEES